MKSYPRLMIEIVRRTCQKIHSAARFISRKRLATSIKVLAYDGRALKLAIAQRRNSLFYRMQHGASIGDKFSSLIHAAELHGRNPFE